MNPEREFEELMRRHRFALVSENKHQKYKNPEGRIFIRSKTPSDWRAVNNMVASLKRVVANPLPSSEVIEEERQRRELESSILLDRQRKPSVVGISGAGKGKKPRGVGIYYVEKVLVEPTLEMLAQQQNARQRSLEREAERKAKRAVRRAAEEWNRMICRTKKAVRNVERCLSQIEGFVEVTNIISAARNSYAKYLRHLRKTEPQEVKALTKEIRKAGLNKSIQLFAEQRQDGKLDHLIERGLKAQGHFMGFLYLVSDAPKAAWVAAWLAADYADSFTLNAQQVRILQRVMRDILISGSAGEVAKWLVDAVVKLRVGRNSVDEKPQSEKEME